MKNYTFSGNHPSMELVAELLNDLKKAETTLAAALARAETAEADADLRATERDSAIDRALSAERQLEAAEAQLAALKAAGELSVLFELTRLAMLTGIPVDEITSAHEMSEKIATTIAALKAAGELRFLEPRFQWSGEVEIDPYEDE